MSESKEIDHPTYRHEPLEEILTQLSDYGEPRLGLFSSGWHCSIDMNTNVRGGEFTVRSEFGMETPTAAAIQCQDRVRAAVDHLNRSLTQ